MNLPLIEKAVNGIRSLADFGGNEPQVKRPEKLPFAKKYPKVSNPAKLHEASRDTLSVRTGMTQIGERELALALSRIPADTNHVRLAGLIREVISAWRDENPNDPDGAAQWELLSGSSSLADVNTKLEAARLAQQQAESEQRELEKNFHEFRSIPAKVEQLTGKVASLEAERQRLTSTNWNARIKYLLEAEMNPKPGVTIHDSVLSLLVQRDTVTLRLEVIDDLISRMNEELKKLAADNERLSKELDVPAHKLS